jgi:hypothetical protein
MLKLGNELSALHQEQRQLALASQQMEKDIQQIGRDNHTINTYVDHLRNTEGSTENRVSHVMNRRMGILCTEKEERVVVVATKCYRFLAQGVLHEQWFFCDILLVSIT